ncbi:hypothetical protein GUJ93_ZPchr0013g37297 [Zizania palustris]|uniref:Uncharacterized protein n=1 Tax=Zizania palustris TaxID=103762 RepID=A0A8J5X313_ZIZPA|nr:hypothetical protein GUJ93_ZPchr0013g37297 [Zizania palustris]
MGRGCAIAEKAAQEEHTTDMQGDRVSRGGVMCDFSWACDSLITGNLGGLVGASHTQCDWQGDRREGAGVEGKAHVHVHVRRGVRKDDRGSEFGQRHPRRRTPPVARWVPWHHTYMDGGDRCTGGATSNRLNGGGGEQKHHHGGSGLGGLVDGSGMMAATESNRRDPCSSCAPLLPCRPYFLVMCALAPPVVPPLAIASHAPFLCHHPVTPSP